jgi:hypothetical protein
MSLSIKEIIQMLLDEEVKATDTLFIRVFNDEGDYYELKKIDSIGTMTHLGLDIFVR